MLVTCPNVTKPVDRDLEIVYCWPCKITEYWRVGDRGGCKTQKMQICSRVLNMGGSPWSLCLKSHTEQLLRVLSSGLDDAVGH